jgi:hypothetical protein
MAMKLELEDMDEKNNNHGYNSQRAVADLLIDKTIKRIDAQRLKDAEDRISKKKANNLQPVKPKAIYQPNENNIKCNEKQATEASTKAKTEAVNPTYQAMAVAAITALKKPTGSSLLDILDYIIANYMLDNDRNSVPLKLWTGLMDGLKNGALKDSIILGYYCLPELADRLFEEAKKSKMMAKEAKEAKKSKIMAKWAKKSKMMAKADDFSVMTGKVRLSMMRMAHIKKCKMMAKKNKMNNSRSANRNRAKAIRNRAKAKAIQKKKAMSIKKEVVVEDNANHINQAILDEMKGKPSQFAARGMSREGGRKRANPDYIDKTAKAITNKRAKVIKKETVEEGNPATSIKKEVINPDDVKVEQPEIKLETIHVKKEPVDESY